MGYLLYVCSRTEGQRRTNAVVGLRSPLVNLGPQKSPVIDMCLWAKILNLRQTMGIIVVVGLESYFLLPFDQIRQLIELHRIRR